MKIVQGAPITLHFNRIGETNRWYHERYRVVSHSRWSVLPRWRRVLTRHRFRRLTAELQAETFVVILKNCSLDQEHISGEVGMLGQVFTVRIPSARWRHNAHALSSRHRW